MSKKASLGTYVLVFLIRSTILSFVTECAKEVYITLNNHNDIYMTNHLLKTSRQEQKLRSFLKLEPCNRKFSIVCEIHVASVKHINYVCGPINPK